MVLELRVLHDPAVGWKSFKPPQWEVFRLPVPMWGTWKKMWMKIVF